MVEFAKVLEVAIDNGDKVRVMEVLNDILEYAIAETDGDLIQRTLETIYIMKEEEIEMNRFNGEVKELETNHIGNALITDKGNEYLIEPYIVESDGEGNISYRHYKPYVLSKELEGFEYEIYLQEEEEEAMKMDLQFFANKSEEEMKMKNEREIESLLSEYFQEEVELINKQEELVKLHEGTWEESVREPRVKIGVSTKNKTNKKKEEIKMKKMSKRNAKKVLYVVALVLIVVFAEEWFNFVDMLVPKSSMVGAEIFLVAPLWISSYLFLAVQSFRWLGGFFITLFINIKELVK